MLDVLNRFGCYPRNAVWELTLACDMRCLHCGSFAGTPRPDELTFPEMERVADQLAELGCERVTLGGGEPTLHPRWDDVGRRLGGHGVRVNLISNGWSWTPAHLDRARRAGLRNVAFSLDGLEEAHDHVRRPGSFRRIAAALEHCAREGFPASVVTHVNRLNARQLREQGALLAGLGVRSWQLQLGIPSGSLRLHDDLVIAPADLLWLVPVIASLRGTLAGRPEVCPADNVGYYGKYERTLRDRGATVCFWLGCRAGIQVVGIESNGNVKGCLSLPSARHGDDAFVEGNLRERSLREIWERPGAFAWNRDFREERLGGFCAVCRYRDLCRGGCGWTAYSHTHDRFDNPYCFYRQAVLHDRQDLIGEDVPSDAERAAAGAP